MSGQKFAGDKKVKLVSPTARMERQFIDANIHRVPQWIQSWHLTLLTIPWSACLILLGWRAEDNLHWLWGSSLIMVLQWLTDSFDGSVGRARESGLVKWGFHMDHLLDFIFMSLAFVGYVFIVSEPTRYWLFVLMLVFGTFMVNAFLSFAATNKFKITYLGVGPTETRLLFIILNTAVIFVGPKVIEKGIPYFTMVIFLMLTVVVFQTQKQIWSIDMQAKHERPSP